MKIWPDIGEKSKKKERGEESDVSGWRERERERGVGEERDVKRKGDKHKSLIIFIF